MPFPWTRLETPGFSLSFLLLPSEDPRMAALDFFILYPRFLVHVFVPHFFVFPAAFFDVMAWIDLPSSGLCRDVVAALTPTELHSDRAFEIYLRYP